MPCVCVRVQRATHMGVPAQYAVRRFFSTEAGALGCWVCSGGSHSSLLWRSRSERCMCGTPHTHPTPVSCAAARAANACPGACFFRPMHARRASLRAGTGAGMPRLATGVDLLTRTMLRARACCRCVLLNTHGAVCFRLCHEPSNTARPSNVQRADTQKNTLPVTASTITRPVMPSIAMRPVHSSVLVSNRASAAAAPSPLRFSPVAVACSSCRAATTQEQQGRGGKHRVASTGQVGRLRRC